jgi:hypothetical protein
MTNLPKFYFVLIPGNAQNVLFAVSRVNLFCRILEKTILKGYFKRNAPQPKGQYWGGTNFWGLNRFKMRFGIFLLDSISHTDHIFYTLR